LWMVKTSSRVIEREIVACQVDLVRRGAHVIASQFFSMNGITSLSLEKKRRLLEFDGVSSASSLVEVVAQRCAAIRFASAVVRSCALNQNLQLLQYANKIQN
jgi:hypothetical protein